ncbi:unnamed protein product, partial [Polarella glacialis]
MRQKLRSGTGPTGLGPLGSGPTGFGPTGSGPTGSGPTGGTQNFTQGGTQGGTLQLAEEVEIAKPVLKVTGNQSQQKVIKALRKRLDQAKESEVEVQPYLLAARLLASLEIAEGIRFNNPEALAKCIEEGLAAGLKEHEVRQGKALLAKIEVARASSSEDPDELRGVMALAKEVGISETSKEMVVALNRLAFLELRAATAETNIEVLRAAIDFARENNVEKDMIAKAVYKWTLLLLDEAMLEYDLEKLLLCMQDAKELKAPKEVIEAAKVKLRNIDAKAHMEWVTVELEEALAVAKESGARSGPIREAIENAIRAKVDHSEIEPAQHRLSFLELGEVIRNLDATKDMVQKTIQRAKAVGYEESGEEAERRMGEAYIRIQQIEAEAVQKERRENMLIAAKGVDPFTLQAAIDAARECGVDEEELKTRNPFRIQVDSYEVRLSKHFESAIERMNRELPQQLRILYRPFDMKSHAKSNPIYEIFARLAESVIMRVGFFHTSKGLYGKPERLQSGVVRTNCVDCLDRTNVLQFFVGLEVLKQQLTALNLLPEPRLDFDSQVVFVLSELYDLMGDHLALQYAGSVAHKKYQLLGSRPRMMTSSKELLTSIHRHYNNSFTDNEKQFCLNLFLGIYQPSKHPRLHELDCDSWVHHKVLRDDYTPQEWWKAPLQRHADNIAILQRE